MLTCSRSFSAWLNIFGLPVSGAGSVRRGKSAGRLFLLRTGYSWLLCPQSEASLVFQKLFATTVGSSLFLLYCFISIVWSDYPFISFKRWIKILGHPIMALIVLTEPDPEEALTRLMKRCAYVVVPVSILLIKYYPQLGTTYDEWTGTQMNNGIAIRQKLAGCRLSDPGFLFLLVFAANLAH